MNYNEYRRKSRPVQVGRITVGGDAPVSVQSMTNTKTSDIEATVAQIRALQSAGCDIVRMAVPDADTVRAFGVIREQIPDLPLVADIHFDYRLAVGCAEAGADKIRINPGNIGDAERVRAVVSACRQRNIPIRIGVNSGSLEKHILAQYGAPTAEALAQSAMEHVRLLEQNDFYDILISVKSSDPRVMIGANRLLAEMTPYPLHLGVTEAGTPRHGIIKSSAGIGSLLCDGIGDTVRVSLTADPLEEVAAGRALLDALGVSPRNITVVSCPTCGRTRIDLIALAQEFERRMARGDIRYTGNLKVALMGCAVNGPGEAREADIGIAGGVGEAVLIRHGEIVRKLPEEHILDELIDEINRFTP